MSGGLLSDSWKWIVVWLEMIKGELIVKFEIILLLDFVIIRFKVCFFLCVELCVCWVRLKVFNNWRNLVECWEVEVLICILKLLINNNLLGLVM